MKRKCCFILFFSFILAFESSAQISVRFYYTKYWELTTQDSAYFFRVSGFDTIHSVFEGTVEDSNKDDKPVMKGVYKNGMKEGEFTFYFPNGQVESTGNYTNNLRTGVWQYFYENGVPKQEVEFSGIDPKVIFFSDATGTKILENGNGKWREEYEVFKPHHKDKVTNEGQYKEGKRAGVWICKFNGAFFYKEKYVDGKFKSGYLTNDNGTKKKEYQKELENKLLPPNQFGVVEKFKAVAGISRANYPFLKSLPTEKPLINAGNAIYNFVEQPPEFPEGPDALKKFIHKVMRYPLEGRRNRIEGRVFVQFVIEKDGTITHIKIVKGIDDSSNEFNEEAIRIVKLLPKWTPGRQNNYLVRVMYVLPISFKL
jgi:TonB family protein